MRPVPSHAVAPPDAPFWQRQQTYGSPATTADPDYQRWLQGLAEWAPGTDRPGGQAAPASSSWFDAGVEFLRGATGLGGEEPTRAYGTGLLLSAATPFLPFGHLPKRLRGLPEEPPPPIQWEGLPGFYSPLRRLVDRQGETLTVKKWLDAVKQAPKAEREWKEVEGWLRSQVEPGSSSEKTRVTKAALLDYLKTREVSLRGVGYNERAFRDPNLPFFKAPEDRVAQATDYIGPVEEITPTSYQIQFEHPELRGHAAQWGQEPSGQWRATVPLRFGAETAGPNLNSTLVDSEAEARAWVLAHLHREDSPGYVLLADQAAATRPAGATGATGEATPALREYQTYAIPNPNPAHARTYKYKRLVMPGEVASNRLDPEAFATSHAAPEQNQVVHIRSQDLQLPAQAPRGKWVVTDKAGRVVGEEWTPWEAEKTRRAGADRTTAFVPGGTELEAGTKGRSIEEVQSDWANAARRAREDEVERVKSRLIPQLQQDGTVTGPLSALTPEEREAAIGRLAERAAEKQVPEHFGWRTADDDREALRLEGEVTRVEAAIEALDERAQALGHDYYSRSRWPLDLRTQHETLRTERDTVARQLQTLKRKMPAMPYGGPFNPTGYQDLALKAELLEAARRKDLEWIGLVGGGENASRYGYASRYSGGRVDPKTGEIHALASGGYGSSFNRPDAPVMLDSKSALDYFGPDELADLRRQRDEFLAAHPNTSPRDTRFDNLWVDYDWDPHTNERFHTLTGYDTLPPELQGLRFPNAPAAETHLRSLKDTANAAFDPAWEDQSLWPSVTFPETRTGPTVSGKGMFLTYDDRMRHMMERLLAPFGGGLAEQKTVRGGGGRQAYLWVMRLSPEIKKQILESGFPLFTALAALQASGAPDAVLDYVRQQALAQRRSQ